MPTPSSNSTPNPVIAIIGGGPAGFFAALTAKEANPACQVVIFEKSARVLGKVKISGGGRCNLTHDCGDPRRLADHYPRGHRELIGPFSRFGTAEANDWFTTRGVPLRTFSDGCVFPQSNSSQSVIDCLVGEAHRLQVEIRHRTPVTMLARQNDHFTLTTPAGTQTADKILIATGGKAIGQGENQNDTLTGGYALATGLGHNIALPLPSLFTFTVKDTLLQDLPGIVVEQVVVKARALPGQPKTVSKLAPQDGPLLITHWGVSGPAVLKLSAWGARVFLEADYHFTLVVDWVPQLGRDDLATALRAIVAAHPAQRASAFGHWNLSRRLWERLLDRARIPAERRWGELGRKQTAALITTLKATELEVSGQSTFKDEFVTCGGVPLKEVDLRTMASRLTPGLHFAGEVLDIDGVTGGFNFQACWTTGYLAGLAMAAERN